MIITHGRGIYTADTVDVAGVRPVGPACGQSGKPTLVALSPVLGAGQLYSLRSAAASAPLSLMLAVGRANPIDFGKSCILQPSLTGLIFVPVGSTSPQGAWNGSLPIPVDRVLLGVLLTAQNMIYARGAPLFGIAELSNGLEMRLGR